MARGKLCTGKGYILIHMLRPLTDAERRWVEETLASMTLEERAGHLLCPEDRDYPVDEWRRIMQDVPLGSVFFARNTPARLRECAEAIQSSSRIPVLVASDLEHGAGIMIEGCTDFPFAMAGGAANDPDLMRVMGRATAKEGRHHGLHWTFSPVVDLNINFQNPVTNVRSLGDNVENVALLARAWIEGMQETGQLAATAKHFPGDGMDDRDQHLCTSINWLPFGQWLQYYGHVWRAVIDAGVMSVMCGHISLPDYEGLTETPNVAMPATLNPRLQIDLLRRELGFEGVVVSDAAPMVGMTSRVPSEEQAVANILSGSDVFLFADARKDFKRLLDAVNAGRISRERLDQSVRRVLEMKARLGLHRDAFGPAPTAEETAAYRFAARAMAQKSITLIRPNHMTPAKLKAGDRVLTVTVMQRQAREELAHELGSIDDELRARGLQVDHLSRPSNEELIARAGDYACVFVNIVHTPHALMGTIRLTGEMAMTFWRSFWVDHPNTVFTSFGSPYHLYEFPHLPNMFLAYGPSEFSQEAAVSVWLGERPPEGICPVQQPLT
jgi:beta-N-acetylhexosaminidase